MEDPVRQRSGTPDVQLPSIAMQKQIMVAERVLIAQLWKEHLSGDPWHANWTDVHWRSYAGSRAMEDPPGLGERYSTLRGR